MLNLGSRVKRQKYRLTMNIKKTKAHYFFPSRYGEKNLRPSIFQVLPLIGVKRVKEIGLLSEFELMPKQEIKNTTYGLG